MARIEPRGGPRQGREVILAPAFQDHRRVTILFGQPAMPRWGKPYNRERLTDENQARLGLVFEDRVAESLISLLAQGLKSQCGRQLFGKRMVTKAEGPDRDGDLGR
jgi:hypothetical protein